MGVLGLRGKRRFLQVGRGVEEVLNLLALLLEGRWVGKPDTEG